MGTHTFMGERRERKIMWVIKSQHTWMKAHATRGEDKTWRCNETGKELIIETTGRSIWAEGLPGGYGEVRPVAHIYCPACEPNFKLPNYGKPIDESELINR